MPGEPHGRAPLHNCVRGRQTKLLSTSPEPLTSERDVDHSYARRKMRGFMPEAIEHARQRYEGTEERVASIAADFGLYSKTITTLAHKQGWTLRKGRPPCDVPTSVRLNQMANKAVGNVQSSPPDLPEIANVEIDLSSDIAARLELALEKNCARWKACAANSDQSRIASIEAERTARTLATLTETLLKVRRLRDVSSTPSGTNHDDLPADIDGFLDALARRIDPFVRSRTDGRLLQLVGRVMPCGLTRPTDFGVITRSISALPPPSR